MSAGCTTADRSARIEVDYSREMFDKTPLPERALGFPELRYMGSIHRD